VPIQRGDDSQSKVVRGDLRLPRNDKLRQLRAEIDLGVLDAEAYRTEPLTDDLLREIADKGRQLAESRKPRPT
jgi:hypothetical protein